MISEAEWMEQWQLIQQVREEVSKVVIGQGKVLEEVLITMLAGGHALLEGVPGLGKTLLVRTIADCLDISFSRIQFTPDLMPADIIGTQMIMPNEQGGHSFSFQPGPVFGHLILADEINRATPKTQSALLEAMEENTVTVAMETRTLPEPFFVLATQNPLESEGTYLLPEAQLDRFLLKIQVVFPTTAELKQIMSLPTTPSFDRMKVVANGEKFQQIQQLVEQILVSDSLMDEAVDLVFKTHPDYEHSPDSIKRYVLSGVGPRGGQALIRAMKARAFLHQRFHVSREDLEAILPAVFRHRIIRNFEAEAVNISTDSLIEELLSEWRKERSQ